MSNFKEKYLGTKDFYLYALGIAVPMILQNLITNFVSMLDNIMVGQVGTAQMSGVSIINQFIFVFNLTLFGGLSGAGIFGTQFFGKGDHQGQKYTFRFRLLLVTLVSLLGILIFWFFGQNLLSLFLSGDDSPQMIADTEKYGMQYLKIMLLGFFPYAYGQAYASAARECGETRIPMYASLSAIGINLLLDYGLIFGQLGMPRLGVCGAAIATVIAKWIEALVIILWVHLHPGRNKYSIGLFQGFYIPGKLAKEIIIKGCPLLVNEFLWSLGVSVVAQCFSVRGIEVVAARNIASTLTNLFGVIYIQLGTAIGIIVGAKLGAGNLEEAKDTDRKLIFFSILVSLAVTLLLLPLAKVFPDIYNTEDSIKNLASYYILIQTFAIPLWSYTNACYFTLRSGGKTGITFLFDFVFTWLVMIPAAFVLTNFTGMEIHLLMAVVTYTEVIKVVVGYLLVRSGIWVNRIV